MKRYVALKILNPILAILALNQIVTGFLGGVLSHEAFEILHKGGGIVFAIAILGHVMLNWGWVKSTFSRSKAATPQPPVTGR